MLMQKYEWEAKSALKMRQTSLDYQLQDRIGDLHYHNSSGSLESKQLTRAR